MAEDYELCTYEKHHKQKILLFLSSMRSHADTLRKDKFKIEKIANEIEAIAPEFDKASFIAYAKGTMKKLDKLDTMHEYETEYKDLMSPEEYQHHTSNINYRRA